MNRSDYKELKSKIKSQGLKLGFDQVGITDTNLEQASQPFQQWLKLQYHGEMHYLSRHGEKRWRPEKLIESTLRIICVRINYWPNDNALLALDKTENAYISRYALGRDYHKLIRKRLQKLAEFIEQQVDGFQYRVFTDSAPVMEKPLAQKSGLGWIGKHTNLINQDAGSWFFLGEIYTDLPLPIDEPVEKDYCGVCRRCIDICPTQAIIAPFILDARRCISYHTIELKGAIPVEFRTKMGNRIYGCDDCQLVCPWNKFATKTNEIDFLPRHNLNNLNLTQAFRWSEKEFFSKTEGSAIRRIGYQRWLRNLAVALGNAPSCDTVIKALKSRENSDSDLVKEHVIWALKQQLAKQLV